MNQPTTVTDKRGQNKNGEPKPAAPQTNWEDEAKFWQLKYFELLIHTTQTITALSRPMLAAAQLQQLQQQAQALAAQNAQAENG